MDWEAYVHLAFDEIRQAGAGSPQVARRLRASLEDLCRLRPADRKPVLDLQLEPSTDATKVVMGDDFGDRRSWRWSLDRQGACVAAGTIRRCEAGATRRTTVRRRYHAGRARAAVPGRVRLPTAGDQPKADRRAQRGHPARRSVPDPARHHRIGQERPPSPGRSRGAAADLILAPNKSARRPADAGDARVLPTTGSSTSSATTTTTSPRRTSRRATRTSRRTRRSTTRSTGCATRRRPAC